jgi:hypothetical protein
MALITATCAIVHPKIDVRGPCGEKLYGDIPEIVAGLGGICKLLGIISFIGIVLVLVI